MRSRADLIHELVEDLRPTSGRARRGGCGGAPGSPHAELGSRPRLALGALRATSLVIDYVDVVRYLMGDRPA